MKNFNPLIKLCIALIVLCTACNKKEQPLVENETAELEKFQLNVPLTDGRTEVEMKVPIIPKSSISESNPYLNLFTQITNPDKDYIKSTTLINVSKLASNKVYDSIADKKLKINFVSGLLKMDRYPKGWTARWNVLPFTECDTPQVFYTQQKNYLTITLSKYCETFGFELSPNLYSSFEFAVGFYTSQENSPVASITQITTTPSGARLFAVKSKRPFNVIEVQFTGSGLENYSPYGFAIANIRYKVSQ